MANKSTKKGVDLKPDNILKDISTSHGNSKYIVIQGILGESDKSSVKIYLNYELNAYVVVPIDNITHRGRIKDDAGLELSVLHVDRNIKLELIQISKEQIESDFLEEVLMTAPSSQFSSFGNGLAWTPLTPPITLATRFLCPRTPRLTVTCSMTCTLICPKPWTKNWFCRDQSWN